jgi:hypothetical protein
VQFGRIPDDDVGIPTDGDRSTDLGSHFLMANASDSSTPEPAKKAPPQSAPASDRGKSAYGLQNPPKCDIINPKNKFCLPCNHEFNRRQAFVEHCRCQLKILIINKCFKIN